MKTLDEFERLTKIDNIWTDGEREREREREIGGEGERGGERERERVARIRPVSTSR